MISCKNLKKVYKSGNSDFYALNNLSLDIKEKEICVIIGPSGSGKTTLLNVIGGIDQVDSGSIIAAGESLVSCPYFSDSFLIDYTENAM